MKINAGKGWEGLTGKVQSLISTNAGLAKSLQGTELAIGYDNDGEFGVPAHAMDTAIACGDSLLAGNPIINAATEAMLKVNPDKVQMKPIWNHDTGKFDIKFAMAGDADFNPLVGQAMSPWNIAYLGKIWKEPLAYSNAKKMVKRVGSQGNPWADVFTMFLEEYAGWGVIGQAGDLHNNMTNDVNVKNGMASFPIINIMGTYSVTLGEQKFNKWGPMGSNPIGRKQRYLDYVMDMIDCILIYFGNEETNTPGLFDITPIKQWAVGQSLQQIAGNAGNTTKGSTVYQMLAETLNAFLTKADNKWSKVKIAVSPQAYNLLQTLPYSNEFSAESVMRTFVKNYKAGEGPGHQSLSVEFVSEPLLKAKSEFNPTNSDYMVITCPEIGGGPENESQETNFYATALEKFVFPVIPGMYNHQYKTLRRVAGMIAPIPSAVEIYSGFGVQ